jgi:hypothetical protein
MVLSNLTGASLWSSIMGGADFTTNPYSAIGQPSWTPPSWGWKFSYHEVAWEGNCGDNELVYDACLKVNGNGDPSTAPRSEEWAAAMQFSDGSWSAPYVYREKLATPNSAGYDACVARPALKARKPIR